MNRTARTARVLAAALRTWTTVHRSAPAAAPDPAVRLEVRQPGDWEHVGTVDLDGGRAARVLDMLREDLVATTAGTLAAHVDGYLTEARALGRRRLHARDLLDAAARAGCTKRDLAAHLAELVDAGHLAETRWPGVYRIQPLPTWSIRPGLPAARTR
jgi:hypothetical protein